MKANNKFKDWILLLVALSLFAVSPQAWAITISFDYTYDTGNFFNTQDRKDTLEAAGNFFESRLTDDLLAISPGGSNTWTASFWHPSAGVIQQVVDLQVPADTLIVYAGAFDQVGTLGSAAPGWYSSIGGGAAFEDIVKARGESGALNTPPTDFGPWGGSIRFQISTNWYFDSDTSTDESFSGFDFFSVALHELGHVLGIGTSGSWDNYVNAGVFTGPASTASYGGNVPLDGDDHWDPGVTSTINGSGSFGTAMTAIAEGQRKRFTDLELASLSDIGWEVTAVPLPSTLLLLASGIAFIFAWRKRGVLG